MALSITREIDRILIEKGYLSEEVVRYLARGREVRAEDIIERAMVEGYLTEEQVARAVADHFALPYVELKGCPLSKDPGSRVPLEVMVRHEVIPYGMENGHLVVAVADPTNVEAVDEIELTAGVPVSLVVASSREIKAFLKRLQESEGILREAADGLVHLVKEAEEDDKVLSLERFTKETSPIIKLVDSTILESLNRRASDIHVESGPGGVVIKYRIDGMLYPAAEPIDAQFQSQIISRIKVMSELDISEKRIPQDGRFKIRFQGKVIDFRVSILPTIFGEDAVIRILDKESITAELGELRLDILGFNPRELKRFRRMIREPYGMILVTGPTGSGKTTTLYGALSEINRSDEKIITIEDPVEYQLKDAVQIPVNEKKGLTFARGLRSILRHDPDKIMVGEIRDPETAQIAVQSALTGHLVFTTVHANNIFDVIGRFIHMGIDPYNFVSALNCVLAQRLVRTICPACKGPVQLAPGVLEDSGLDPGLSDTHTFYQGRGCAECYGTGYRGRTAIFELLDLTDDMREMIAGRTPLSRLKKAARECGTVFLREAAVEKVLEGATTLSEINRVTFVE
ncbi:MAG: GspE/PulE family protein [Thermodesulfobacteriota bacterium]